MADPQPQSLGVTRDELSIYRAIIVKTAGEIVAAGGPFSAFEKAIVAEGDRYRHADRDLQGLYESTLKHGNPRSEVEHEH